ncbi:nicotinamide riboside transporter PnuC [Macrococcus animalis]|uniref:nicotinamide riboside transporter PnuC n=1 Tax=Macrococcus animalis TaxID=3395467 RepID=UPI0039BF32AC
MFLIKDFKGFTLFEKLFFGLYFLAQVGILIYFYEPNKPIDWINIIASITMILSLIMSAKGRLSTFVYGLIALPLYGWISYQRGLYGEVGLQFVFITFQFIGFYAWVSNRHSNHLTEDPDVKDVDTKGLNKKQWLFTIISTITGYTVITSVLLFIHAKQPFVDSINVSLNLVGQILMTLRFKEQWFFWIAVNIVSIILWIRSMFVEGGKIDDEGISMAVMWLAALINCGIGYYNWKKLQVDTRI